MGANSDFSDLLRDSRSLLPSDLDRLLRFIDTHPEKHCDALPALYHHLALTRLTPKNTVDEIRLHVQLATMAMTRIFPPHEASRPRVDKIVSSLVAHLPLIWQWVNFLSARCIVQYQEFGEYSQDIALEAVAEFYMLATTDRFRKHFCTRQSVRTLFFTWLACGRGTRILCSHPARLNLQHAIFSILDRRAGGALDSGLAADVQAALEEQPRAVAYCLRSQLGVVMHQPARNPQEILGKLRLVHNYLAVAVAILQHSSRVLHEVLADRFVPLLASIVSMTAQRPVDASFFEVVFELMIFCLGLFSEICSSPHKAIWMEQAIEGNIIQNLLRFSPWLVWGDRDGDDRCKLLVIKFFASHASISLIHRSVFHAVLRALKKVDREGLADEYRQIAPIAPHWKFFRHVVKSRALVEPKNDQYKRRCDNPACSDPTRFLKRCGGCMLVYYCSEKCQRLAWKSGEHSPECKRLQRCCRVGEIVEPYGKQADYILDVAAGYLTVNEGRLESIREEINDRSGGAPGTVALVSLNHAIERMEFNVQPMTAPPNHHMGTLAADAPPFGRLLYEAHEKDTDILCAAIHPRVQICRLMRIRARGAGKA